MNPQRCSKIASLLILIFISCCITPAPSWGQTETASHRKLELPTSGTVDLQQQMQMLKQLQSWMVQKPVPDDANYTNSKSGISPEQLESIKQTMKQLGIPEEAIPDLSLIPPDVLSRAMNDPNTQEQVKDLLQEFNRTRQMPQRTSDRQSPLLPPKTNRSPTAKEVDSRSGKQSRLNGATKPTTAPPNNEGQSANQNAVDDIQKRFNELRQRMQASRVAPQNSSNQRQSTAQSAPSAQPATSGQPSTRQEQNPEPKPFGETPQMTSTAETSSASSKPPSNERVWKQLLEEIIRKQRNSGEAQSLPTDDLSKETRVGTLENGPFHDSVKPPRSIDRKEVKSVVSEFLEHHKQQQAIVSPNYTTDADASLNPAAQQTRIAEEVQRKQQQAKSDLKQNGFQATLNKITREAKKQAESSVSADSESTTTSNSSSDMNKALFQMLSGLGKDIVEIAKSVRPDSSGRHGNRNAMWHNRPTAGSDDSAWTKSVAELISGLATVPEASNTDSPAVVSKRGSAETGPMGRWGGTIWTLAAVAIILLILFQKIGWTALSNTVPTSAPTLTASNIHSKQDVVAAFHQLAMHPSREVQLWWTHKQVEVRISQATPHIQQPMSTLADLYEQARYLPEDVDFDETKLTAARTALKLCGS